MRVRTRPVSTSHETPGTCMLPTLRVAHGARDLANELKLQTSAAAFAPQVRQFSGTCTLFGTATALTITR